MAAWRVALVVAGLAVTGVAFAQSEQYAQSANPYQGELPYTVGTDLMPAVEVDGVRWRLLRVAPKDPEDVRSGQLVAGWVTLELENTRDRGATAVVVVLFEDEQGNGLERVECDPVAVPRGEVKTVRQKIKLQGDVFLATRKVYLFCEIQE